MREPLRVYVEFDRDGDPIAGTLNAGAGQQPFTGWLGLISGLEKAVGNWHRANGQARRPTRRPSTSSEQSVRR
jgi:hypothetical protein